MTTAQPQKEHQWLHRLIGDWTYEHEGCPEPGKPPEKFRGTQHVRSLGGIWILAEGKGDMPGGGTAQTQIMLGYDTKTKRFAGTFIGSMMTNLWIYDGALDPTGRMLVLNSDGPSFTDETKTAKYQDIFEIVNDDHHILRSQVLGDDGKWQPFMEAHYRRAK